MKFLLENLRIILVSTLPKKRFPKGVNLMNYMLAQLAESSVPTGDNGIIVLIVLAAAALLLIIVTAVLSVISKKKK